MSHPYNRKKGNHTFRLSRTMVTALLATTLTGCIFNKDKKSGVRDLTSGESAERGLKQMKMKYAFTFLGSAGARYPIYMSADVLFNDDKTEATWNSTIDSDGGLVAASNESKTLKPDKNLILKSATPGTQSGSDVFVFNAGNPELGRGLALKVQKVTIGTTQVWKVISLTYYGYETEIEDSVAAAASSF